FCRAGPDWQQNHGNKCLQPRRDWTCIHIKWTGLCDSDPRRSRTRLRHSVFRNFEFIAHTLYGNNIFLADFFAKFPYMDVDGAIGDDDGIFPYALENVFPGVYFAWPRG